MYKVQITHFNFTAQCSNHQIVIDAQDKKGITPSDLFLASLGSCLGVYIRKYIKNTHINLEGFTITVQSEFCTENPIHFKAINIYIDLKKPDIDEKRKESILRFIKNCPLHHTLKMNSDIHIALS